MKQIEIDGKKYNIDCNALTYIQHKKIFNKGILDDIAILKKYFIIQTSTAMEIQNKNPNLSEEQILEILDEKMRKHIDDFIEAITRITYTLIYCADETTESYKEFLKGIKHFRISDKWIVEVTEFAVDCFC